MKILFYLRLVQVRRALPNSSSDSGAASPFAVAFHSTLDNCQLYYSIAVVIPCNRQGRRHIFFNAFI